MPSRVMELSGIIADNTKIVDDYLTRNGLPALSFDVDGPPRVSIPVEEKEVVAAHVAVLGATQELRDLMKGPASCLMSISANDVLSLEGIYRFKIAQALPVGEQRSYLELSDITGLNVIDLRCLLRHAMCNHIFCEPQSGFVSHTAASRLLVENRLIQDFVGMSVEEKFPGTARTVDALFEYKAPREPNETGFSLGHNTDKGLYEEMDRHPARGRRWAGAMNAYAAIVPLAPLISSIDWAAFGDAQMVDVGGGWGPVSLGIARQFSNLTFVVQDLPETVAEGPSKIPADLGERFDFMVYNFLDEQPVKDASIYFFRAIFHNWPDRYCIRILRNQVPALKPSARLIINDNLLPEPSTLPASVEKQRRESDLNMLTYFGSRERTLADWEQIFQEADKRFRLREAIKPPNDTHIILDIEWTG